MTSQSDQLLGTKEFQDALSAYLRGGIYGQVEALRYSENVRTFAAGWMAAVEYLSKKEAPQPK